ncbi:normal mucosa of esophagus-specific gene 1 protein-like [Tachyglossus aculeatus]|uniref:normal mucosa of esophagus-specific gene 1 protein-like n=1 Tax=Tachyglossus aculeatus TaxID=9261 RepID=UPI0018F5A80F|nr:normal mucosa of esophagus-specific gene 1 protein-like [Tachyglossus aculeatus]
MTTLDDGPERSISQRPSSATAEICDQEGIQRQNLLSRSQNPGPRESMDPTQPQKLLSINQQWQPIEMLQKVRKPTA